MYTMQVQDKRQHLFRQTMNQRLQRFRRHCLAGAVFLREWIRSPRDIGMVCPSGAELARCMAAHAVGHFTACTAQRPQPCHDSVASPQPERLATPLTCLSEPSSIPTGTEDSHESIIVELGAGTGTVTSELLKQGIPPQRLLIVERSANMVDLLRLRFPLLPIIHGDAAQLSTLIPENKRVCCVVSSLPLVSLPETPRKHIIRELETVISHNNGLLIQYTYSWNRRCLLDKAGFHCVSRKRVWRNVPPARVMTFTKKSEMTAQSA